MQVPRFRQYSMYTWSRRAGVLLRGWLQNRFVRSKNVRRIEIGGRTFKRVTFPDTYFAERVARNVAVFRSLDILPGIVAIEDRELLVEFVEGAPLPEHPTAALIERLAEFFAVVYGVDSRVVALAETDFVPALHGDLEFLEGVGVLTPAAHHDLRARVDRDAPAQVRVGYDYLDALAKNFIVRPDGRLMAIDIEDLAAGELTGTGVAKALLRGLEPHRDALLDGIAKRAGFDLRPAMPFVELHFLARWTKRAFLKGRHLLVDPAHFERLR